MSQTIKDLPTCNGVFVIINKVSNKGYVGSTINLRRTYSYYNSMLNNSKFSCKELQEDYNKQLPEDFIYSVYYKQVKNKELEKLKLKLVKAYKDSPHLLYNTYIDKTSRQKTEEVRKAISISLSKTLAKKKRP